MAMTEITKYIERKKPAFIELYGERGASAYVSSVLLAVANDASGNLAKCDPGSIYVSALRAATLKLSVDPSTKQAYLVPFKNRATLIVGYKGLYDMAIRTGRYRYVNVGKIFEGQDIVEDQISGLIKIEGNRTGKKHIGWIGAFEMVNGFAKTIYMTIEEIHAHKEKFSRGWNRPDSAWKTNVETMEKKSVLRNLLNNWGYLDPSDSATLNEIEQEQPIDVEAVEIPEDLDAAEAETVQRSEAENLAQLGFGE